MIRENVTPDDTVDQPLSIAAIPNPFLTKLCDELVTSRGAHTVLLYGSRANATDGPASDYDIAAFGPFEHHQRDTRVLDGAFLDIFLYPESDLEQAREEHLKLRGSRILLGQEARATSFLARIESLYTSGPAPLPPDELAVRTSWARKMCARIQRNDLEGNYRRAWLLSTLLEDYFQMRGLWFEGPKRSFGWLAEHDPSAHTAFEKAMLPGASHDAIASLVEHVVDLSHAQFVHKRQVS